MGSIKKPMSMSRLGMVLQQAGFQSKRVGKAGIRGWLVRVRDTDEIKANRVHLAGPIRLRDAQAERPVR